MLRFQLRNMTTYGGRANSVFKVLLSVDPNASVDTDSATREVRVESSATKSDLLATLKDAGCPAERCPGF
ncbi:copper chaperone [Microvirga arabica]|nr:copper chaperone [Microvirga arabica]